MNRGAALLSACCRSCPGVSASLLPFYSVWDCYLAHFCEHMLFLGTEKYPSENEYFEYVQNHAGAANAYTATDHTNYHFDVGAEHLEGAMDRFAQFFLAPLFTESATEREVNAVDSEHNNNVKNDQWRMAQIERSLSDQAHDYSKFGTGNIDTLLNLPKAKGVDTRSALLTFHKTWYSSHLMSLCVVGAKSLDQLQDMCLQYFINVNQIDGCELRKWEEHPYGKEQLTKAIKMVPIKDSRIVNISFPMPDLTPHYRTNPAGYLGHLLGHEGPGSLLSELKRRGWTNSLSAGYSPAARGFGFFTIGLDLSEEGLDNVEGILHLMFEYIGLLRSKGVQEWIFDECRRLNDIFFRFKEKSTSLSLATKLASDMWFYELDETLIGPYKTDQYKPEIIHEVLNRLVPENMNYVVVSTKFAGAKGNVKEKWYGTEYNLSDFDDDFLKSANKSMEQWEERNHFKLPVPNEFIPQNFERVSVDIKEVDIGKYSIPSIVSDGGDLRVWHKADDEFDMPKMVTLLRLATPLAYADPVRANCAGLLQACLADSLTEYVYAPSLAGLSAQWAFAKEGATLTVRGYNEKLPLLAERMAEKLREYRPDENRFAVLKEWYTRELRNFNKEQPYHHAVYHTNVLLTHAHWTKEQLLETVHLVTVDRMVSFLDEVLSSLHVEALVHGNCNKQSAISTAERVLNALKHPNTQPIYCDQLTLDREHEVPKGEWHIYDSVNDTHPNSAIECIYQIGTQNVAHNAILDLLSQMAAEPSFNILRTKEQLGYIVWAGARRAHGTQSLRVIVQGPRNPKFVEARIEAFLKHFRQEVLEKMDDKTFEQHRNSLATKRLERPKKLFDLSCRHWAEIQSRMYNFDRDIFETDKLQTVTKTELLEFFDRYISAESSDRRKLTSRVFSHTLDAAESKDKDEPEFIDESKAQNISEAADFKEQTALYARPAPYKRVSLPGATAKVLPTTPVGEGDSTTQEEESEQ